MNIALFRSAAGRCLLAIALFISLAPGPADAQLPPYILPPGVRITYPPNHAVFFTPVKIPILAYVQIPYATVTQVDFYADTNFLGIGLDLGQTHAGMTPAYANMAMTNPVPWLAQHYLFIWTNPPPGNFNLTAVARGYTSYPYPSPYGTPPDQLFSRTSAPVNITVLLIATNPNPVDVVSIVATDPIAVADTNAFWVWNGSTNATPCWTNWPPPRWQCFTNFGPKDALFTVRRCGPTNLPITVTYNIGGTASNGVDYAKIPNGVTIAAGSAFALIPIVPIDTDTSNRVKTVILKLEPDLSMSPLPGYVVGFPPAAEALIFDDWPILPPWVLADGTFHVKATGPDGAWFSVQYTSDMVNWTTISTNQVFQGSVDFADPDAANNSSRFYRAVPVSGPPSY